MENFVLIFCSVITAAAIVMKIVDGRTLKKLNKELKEKQKYIKALTAEVESLNTGVIEKNDFISKMSHDIIVTLMSLKGLSSTGIKSLNVKDYDKTMETFGRIEGLSDSIISLINDIVKFYKHDALYDGDSSECVTFNIKEWFDSFKSEFAPKAQSVRLDMSDEKLANKDLVGDKEKLGCVFNNIMSNALRYSKKDSVIGFDLSSQTADDGTETVKFDLSVSAQDISGIDYLLKIFNPYKIDEIGKASNSSNEFSATMIKVWINELNGNVWVGEKEDGYYCTVKIPFAIAETFEAAPEISPEDNTVDLKSKRVLVVEDNEINCEILVEMLETYGFAVDAVFDGFKAIEKFAGSAVNYYDIIITDIIMPEKNGWETALEIRELDREDAKKIPIMAVSGSIFYEDIKRSKESGINVHIKKPIDANQLLSEINKLLADK